MKKRHRTATLADLPNRDLSILTEVDLHLSKTPFISKRNISHEVHRLILAKFPDEDSDRLLKLFDKHRGALTTVRIRREEKVFAPPPKLEHRDVEKARSIWGFGLQLMSYDSYLRTPYWLLIRAAKIDMANNQCEDCGSRKNLQVHHLTYEFRGREHENTDCIIAVCERCHKDRHKL